MVVEYEFPSLWVWFFGGKPGDGELTGTPSALAAFGLTVLVLLVGALLLGYLIAAVRYGPTRAFQIVGATLCQGAIDLVKISPRRVLSLSRLAIREAWRRHVWVILAVYVVVLMFAGLALSSDSPEPAKLYLSFVLQATTYLLMLAALFLSALSLPTDIKQHTIYTVVTKPVRSSEILLGRLIGFTVVCTMLLVIMAMASYVFVGRMVSHGHELTADAMLPVREQGEVVAYEGRTTTDNRHHHTVRMGVDAFRPGIAVRGTADGKAALITHVTSEAAGAGIQVNDRIVAIDGKAITPTDLRTPAERIRGAGGSTVRLDVEDASGERRQNHDLQRTRASVYTDRVKGHSHLVTARYENGQVNYRVGPSEGDLLARVPYYGTLRFRDRQGKLTRRGISVGDLYNYRSFIRGGRVDAAIWTFEGLRAEDYPEGLPLDLTVGVYRSHKGDVEQGVRGSIVVRNPETGRQSQEIIFTAQESKLDRIQIPRFATDAEGKPLDLFSDLVADGKVQVWLRCVDRGQYFGMAQADLYIRSRDASYTVNFFKRYVQVWLQMTIVTSIALFCSTFLSGPVSILLTLFVVVLGHFTSFLYHLTNCVIYRDEFRVFDKMRLARIKLDERGYELVRTMQEQGKTPFRYTTEEQLRIAQELGLDKWATRDRVYGGGPLEAAYRLFTQDNLLSELPREGAFEVMRNVDIFLMHIVQAIINVLPDFERFSTDDYLANGYSIHAGLISQQACATLAFVVSTMIAGYFFLKTREVAR